MSEDAHDQLRAINAENRLYWSDPTVHVVLAAAALNDAHKLARDAAEQAHALAAHARRSQGGKRRAARLREENAERNLRMFDLHVHERKSYEHIAGLYNDEPGPSQVGRIVRKLLRS